MGATTSKASPGKDLSARADASRDMEEAMAKCNDALRYLNTSVSVLGTKRNKARQSALEAFRRGDKAEAAELLRKADLAAADLQTMRRRQGAIERQRSVIEQQQLNTMLTGVLVETSAALHAANVMSAAETGKHPADAVQEAHEKLEEVADLQAEIETSHFDFDPFEPRLADADTKDPDYSRELERLAAMDEQDKKAPEPPKPAKPPKKPPILAEPKDLPSVPTVPIQPTSHQNSAAQEAAHLI